MKRVTLIRFITLMFVILGFVTTALDAQAGHGKGRMTGKVLDPDGKPYAGATVVAYYKPEPGTKFETKSGADGTWIIANLGSGEWRVSTSVPGFVPAKQVINISQIGKNPDVILKLEKITEKNAAEVDASALIDQGNQFFTDGKYEEALQTFQNFLSANPMFFEAYINIGNCLFKLDKLDEAVVQYNLYLEKATDAAPELKARCIAALGEVYLKKNDLTKAQAYFKQSVDLNPKDEILAYNVGEIFFGNGKFEEAEKYFKISAQIKPDWSIPYLKLGYVYTNLGDMKVAVEYFSKFLTMDPEHPEAPSVKELVDSLKE